MKPFRFAVIGDCHYSLAGNYATRNCSGAKDLLRALISRFDAEPLDFVLSLGDLGDGHGLYEVPEMAEVLRSSVHPVYFTVGNHDLVLRNDAEYAKTVGMPAPFYDFSLGDYRFIVLNAFEKSRYSPEGSPNQQAYWQFRAENPWLKVQEWPGLLTEETWTKLKAILNDAQAQGQEVIVFSHVPICYGDKLQMNHAKMPEFRELLDLFESYPNVRAYIAGHLHCGGTAVRNGILHKTVHSVCDAAEPTACIVEADRTHIAVQGIGAEEDFVHPFAESEVFLSGTAPVGAWVMTNCGAITQVGESGTFRLPVPCRGMYCLKAVAEGCADFFAPYTEAPKSDIRVEFQPDPARKLYVGHTDGYAALRITDDGKPVTSFDVAGQMYGSYEPDRPMWHDHCDLFWSSGTYAFTAAGEVKVRVLPKHPELKQAGWRKGDLHAHMIHGENIYIGNTQFSGFIGRAEGYEWLYMAANHGNDGYPTDNESAARALCTPDFFYALNEEFPKARSNHFGNCGVEAPRIDRDMSKITSLQLAEKYIWAKGGVTVPVHPFCGHMACRELCLWLLCAPEKVPCIDFYYHDTTPRFMAEDYWFMLLNRGYEIGCFATSDAAYDVGRTPGYHRGATYLHLDRLNAEKIKEAILHRRTMVSWEQAGVLFEIDGFLSGDHLPADGAAHTLRVDALWQKGTRGRLRVVRNGTDILRKPVKFATDDTQISVTLPVCETENSWYLVILETEDGKIRAASSPIYFRNAQFTPPKVYRLPEDVSGLIAECDALTPTELADPKTLDRFASLLTEAEPLA